MELTFNKKIYLNLKNKYLNETDKWANQRPKNTQKCHEPASINSLQKNNKIKILVERKIIKFPKISDKKNEMITN